MPGILDEIMAHKRRETEALMAIESRGEVRTRVADAPPPRDFAGALRGETVRMIAEIKRASPSAGVIREEGFDPAAIAAEYERAGASALSVLTDERYFDGRLEYLTQAREATALPALCKDFIHRAYQIYRARAAGADAVLLIAAVLDAGDLRELLDLARDLGMAALVETHNRDELALALGSGARIIGINNRDLRTFETHLSISEAMASSVPGDRTLVGESGVHTRADVERLAAAGVDAALVGSALMSAESPGDALAELVGVPADSDQRNREEQHT